MKNSNWKEMNRKELKEIEGGNTLLEQIVKITSTTINSWFTKKS